jgi:hypothetical protein
MKVVVTSGHPDLPLAALHESLCRSGLADAQPSRRERITPAALEQRLLAAHDVASHEPKATAGLIPGRMWMELATDLFLANLESGGGWGWASPSSVGLLDFWAEFDPQTRFVLVYASVEYLFAMRMDSRLALPDWLRSWQSYHERVLDFFLSHQQRCLLVAAERVTQDPTALVEAASELFCISLTPIGEPEVAAPDPLGLTLSRLALADATEARALYEELQSAANLPALELQEGGASWRLEEAYSRYSNLQAAEKEALRLPLLTARVSELSADLQASQQMSVERGQELATLGAALAALEAAHHHNLAALRDARESESQLRLLCEETRTRLSTESTLRTEEKDKAEGMSRELERLAADCEDKQALLKAVAQEAQQYHKQSMESERQIAHLLATVAEQQEALNVESARANVLRATLEQLNSDHGIAVAKRREADVSLETLRREFSELREHGQREVLARNERIGADAALLADLQNALEVTSRERDQQAEWCKENDKWARSLQSQLDLTKRDATSLRDQLQEAKSELQRLIEPADGRLGLKEENELLRLQVEQALEELQYYFDRCTELESAQVRTKCQVIDLRGPISGTNWYETEPDGRWAGPRNASVLNVAAMGTGRFEIVVDIVDAMAPYFIDELRIAVNGQPVGLVLTGDTTKPVATGNFVVEEPTSVAPWEIRFDFPPTVSPANEGWEDRRHLAIRIRTVCLRSL